MLPDQARNALLALSLSVLMMLLPACTTSYPIQTVCPPPPMPPESLLSHQRADFQTLQEIQNSRLTTR